MEDFLNVFILLELVDEFQDVLGLFLGQLDRGGRDPFEFGADGGDAFFFEGFLHVAEVGESGSDDEDGLAILAGAFAEFFEAEVDEFEFEIFLTKPGGVEFEDTHFGELEADTAAVAEGAATFIEMGFDVGDGADVVVGSRFYEDCDAVGAVSFIENFFVVGHFLALGAFDGGLDAVFGHVDALCILEAATQGRVGCGVGAAGLDGDGYFLTDARELFGHAVPAGEHGVLAYFENATHIMSFCVFG